MIKLDPSKCAACGGRCCQIYTSHKKGGAFPEGFVGEAEHRQNWRKKFEESGAWPKEGKPEEAAFDPLAEQGKGACEFWRPLGGCVLPLTRRPALCLKFMC